jgi:hypothetical protein
LLWYTEIFRETTRGKFRKHLPSLPGNSACGEK